jgi:MOSC domain-containing protein YiiM
VNVGRPRQVAVRRGRPLMSAIGKVPVDGRVRVAGVNVEGDEQADRRVHGGADKAVYAYAAEDTAWWEAELGRALGPGAFGENLTVAGVDVSGAVIGERWRIGSVELEVAQPRLPCAQLGLRFGDPRMVKRFADARRPGAYLRIVREGEIGAGDAIAVADRPGHDVSVALVSRAILLDEALLDTLQPVQATLRRLPAIDGAGAVARHAAEHDAIIDALAEGDNELASRRPRAHVGDGLDALLRALRRRVAATAHH